jgi:hypothetical protein
MGRIGTDPHAVPRGYRVTLSAVTASAGLLVDSGLRRDGQIVWMRTHKPLPEDEPPVH